MSGAWRRWLASGSAPAEKPPLIRDRVEITRRTDLSGATGWWQALTIIEHRLHGGWTLEDIHEDHFGRWTMVFARYDGAAGEAGYTRGGSRPSLRPTHGGPMHA